MIIRNLLILSLLVLPSLAFAQLEENRSRNLLREGNNAYEEGKFGEAQVAYDRALEKMESTEGHFNLGDALYKQQRFPEAIEAYQKAALLSDSDAGKAKAYHNIGNAHMAQQQYDKSVAAYSQALRHDPHDADARYNLAYALQMLRQEQQQQQGQGDQNEEEQDEQQDQQNEKEQDESQDQQDQNQEKNKDEQSQNEDQDQDQSDENAPQAQQLQSPDMSREQIEQMLENLQIEEKELLQEIPKRKAKPKATTSEKDW